MKLGRPLWAEVDLDAIAHNVRQVQRRIGPRSQVMGVVKANAYGHGAVAVARAALEAGATHLGVACVDEGAQLRKAGLKAPIVVLGYLPPWEATQAVQYSLTPTVTTQETALALARAAQEADTHVPVHVKVDTGMARFGLPPQEVEGFVAFLQTLSGLSLEGLYTHFATADEADKTYTRQQYRAFLGVAERLPQALVRHVANSATVADLSDMSLDMVRPGIALYGCYPSNQVTRSLDLRPALSLKSRVARLSTLSPGDTVSYGRTWTADRASRIALIPCGYADGLPRLLSNRGAVLIRGRRAPIAGRVCMDQFMVDVTHIPDVEQHDEAVLIGRQGELEISVEEVAEQAQTISYEILCALSARVPRYYLRDGRVVERSTLVEHQGDETPASGGATPE
ncbi:MAG TPA: alanine racemase [Dehalococcoidia bacterium]|nr:alanine racemase [Dehalococcoidia bacterium]